MAGVKEHLGLLAEIDPAEFVFACAHWTPFELGPDERGVHLVPALIVRGIEELNCFADSSDHLDEATQLFPNLTHHGCFRGLIRTTPTSGQPEMRSSTHGGPDRGNTVISSQDDSVRRHALRADDARRSFSEDSPARLDLLHSSAQRRGEKRTKRFRSTAELCGPACMLEHHPIS